MSFRAKSRSELDLFDKEKRRRFDERKKTTTSSSSSDGTKLPVICHSESIRPIVPNRKKVLIKLLRSAIILR